MNKDIRKVTANDFFEAYRKMCESGNGDCSHCDIYKRKPREMSCRQFIAQCPNIAIRIVMEWCENSDNKTMLQDLLIKLPNVQMHRIGVPIMCPVHCGYTEGVPEWCKSGERTERCFECWNRPVGAKK